MYKLLLAILFTVLISGSLGAARLAPQPDQEWERFRSVKEGLSVLFPEWPSVVNRGQYRSAPVRGARNYAAYGEGIVYFVICFDNPDHEKPLDYFLETQLRVSELRNAEISAETETSNGSSNGKQYSLKKYDFRKSFSYPGVLRMYETKNRALAVVAIGKDETDPSVARFLQSLEISEKPNGKDIGSGAGYADAAPGVDSPPATSNEVSRKVMILIRPEPQYTEEERRRKLRGGVVLKAVLSSSGKVTNLQVVSGLPELAQSAIEVAHKIYFIPAVKDGRFVSTSVELQYNFSIY